MRLRTGVLGGLMLAVAGCGLQVEGLSTTDDDRRDGSVANQVASCVDNDGDGYGQGCALGPDCDDFDRLTNPGQREYCDYADNDCDGRVDEGMNLGQSCVVTLPTCTVEGSIACTAGGLPFCQPTEQLQEVCNGEDDDCDGRVDEGDIAGEEECDTGLPGVCRVGAKVCIDGAFSCELVVQPASREETCNRLDDDCDGAVDNIRGTAQAPQAIERDCYQGEAGTEGVGPCIGGTQTCESNGIWGPCSGQVLPAVEICDQVDNNCDGRIDNVPGESCVCNTLGSRPCYTGPPGTEGVGDCSGGLQTCVEGRWTTCTGGESLPQPEQCNGLDDDCDGAIDEGALGVQIACGGGFGICRVESAWRCANGELVCGFLTSCTEDEDCDPGEICTGDPTADHGDGSGSGFCRVDPRADPGAGQANETCDGRDDDCDRFVDEGLPGHNPSRMVGDSCTLGVGACERRGTIACRGADGQDFTCNVVPGAPVPERCDGIDNDCDASVDEGLGVGVVCAAGVGSCRRQGVTLCTANGGVECSAVPGQPFDELCDGFDNDCDGQVDEGLGLGSPCNGAAPGCFGVLECNGSGGTRCSMGVGGSLYEAVEVSCYDGIDNDCDGTADNGVAEGLSEDNCSDGIDNDCDGQIDESAACTP